MNAAPHDQQRLLDLQAMDTRLDQLAHRRKGLPEHAELAAHEARLAELRDLTVAATTEVSDIEREQAKAEADVDQVRQRAERDQSRLDSGQVTSAKELESLQHEIASLLRRQGDLEDVQLEVMERLESAQARVGELAAETERVCAARDETVARRDASYAEIDAEAATTGQLRSVLAGQIDAALVTLYEKVRESSGGVGAAALHQRRCEGCRLELNNVDLGRFRAAPPDEVLRCEECRRILVRTDESGL
ncbi:MAG TPA: C4-type zinc ribbon domain-containing protein [Actinomycetes bacterium]|nr:C4-type zinc ribbon domain-containing protein [Actinomycetes bacterium]